MKATGNATAAQVLSGYTFSNSSGNNLTGTMPNLTGIRLATGTAKWGDGGLAVYPEQGYQKGGAGDGEIKVTTAQMQVAEPSLNPANILDTANIFGVQGTAMPLILDSNARAWFQVVSIIDEISSEGYFDSKNLPVNGYRTITTTPFRVNGSGSVLISPQSYHLYNEGNCKSRMYITVNGNYVYDQDVLAYSAPNVAISVNKNDVIIVGITWTKLYPAYFGNVSAFKSLQVGGGARDFTFVTLL
ncbi:hypothetical protein D3C74_350270 [compost metagenome]